MAPSGPWVLGTPFLCAWTVGHSTGKAQKEDPIGELYMNKNFWIGDEWFEFLVDHPEQADKSDLSKLDGSQWSYLLAEQPQFANRCDWSKLDGHDWRFLLQYQPQFSDRRRSHCGRTRSSRYSGH